MFVIAMSGVSCLVRCDERGVPVSRILMFIITTSGVSHLVRCDERGVPVSRILTFVIATSGGFPSPASYQIIELGEK
jgi:hypothetical protein